MAPPTTSALFAALSALSAVSTVSPKPQSSSLIEVAYEHLRNELVAGRLKPGEKLKISSLAEAQSISVGAVREALARLSAEGLVTSEPQRGFTAASMSIAELQDITQVRIEIEARCLRRSMQAGDVEWESRVVGAYHVLMRAPVDHLQGHALPTPPWATAHANFHDALVSACDSPWLLRLREQIYVQSERYRLAAIRLIPPERSLENEHQVLLDAVLARRIEEAVGLMGPHFGETAAALLKQWGSVATPDSAPNATRTQT